MRTKAAYYNTAGFYLPYRKVAMILKKGTILGLGILAVVVVLAGLGLYSWGSLQRSPEK